MTIPVKHCGDILIVVFFAAVIIFTLDGNEHSPEAASTLHITEGDQWNYFTGPGEPPFKWNYVNFDDSKWPRGLSSFGYGNGSYRTLLSDMQGKYQTVYARKEFIVTDPSRVVGITFSLICDGPFVAYINGNEAIRNAVPVPIQLDFSGFTEILVKGRNVLAVQCSNDDINSNEFSFTPFFDAAEK